MGILGGSDIERIGKYINKSSVTLDEFVGGKIICKGFVGTKITLSGLAIKYAFGAPLEIFITENSKQYEDSDVLKYEVVRLPLGAFSYRVEYQEYDVTYSASFLSPSTVVLAYNLEKVIFESDVAGTYSLDIPEGVTQVIVDAVGGGGGGTYGDVRVSSSSGAGGRGGFAGANLRASAKAITSPASLSITIGAGGAAGFVNRSNNTGTLAGTGGSTVISGGGVGITLSGGGRNGGGIGGAGKSNTLKDSGTVGGKGYSSGSMVGGDGGLGGQYGTTTSGGGGGGGGDGSPFGTGGDGGRGGDGIGSSNIPTYYGRPGYNGTRGSGGGGGGGLGGDMPISALGGDGGKGGDGYVRITSRITV